jgi:hypothetical protein
MTPAAPPLTEMTPRCKRLALEWALLILFAVAVGFFYVPACWTINALNPGFTGWCVGLAAHLEGGQRLYVENAHLPLAPLPFVLLHWISPTEKTWMLESVTNFACITLTLLVMHVVLSRLFKPPVPIVTSLFAAAFFFSNEITLLYNSMPQVFVALGCLLCVTLPRHPKWQAILLGVASSLCLLTKQTPGIGMVIGVLLFYAIMHGREGWSFRLTVSRMALYGLATCVTSVLVVYLLSAYLSPSGFVQDVLLTGSEPKGGPAYLIRSLANFGMKTVMGFLFFAFLGVAACAVFSIKRARENAGSIKYAGLFWKTVAAFVAIFAVLVGLFASHGAADGLLGKVLNGMVNPAVARIPCGTLTLRCGYLLVLSTIVIKLLPTGWVPAWIHLDESAAGAIAIAVFACIFHSLSVPEMDTWLTDQTFQPMVVFCLGAVVYALHEGSQRLSFTETSADWPRWALLCSVAFWMATLPLQRAFLLINLLRGCDGSWSDVRYLTSAKMKSSGEGVHELVKIVREITPKESEVLLLPGDPNLEMMFERKRPPLTCLIVFTDQYWEKYIDEDLQKLRDRPPAVMVIGPRNYMKNAPRWSPAAIRFIERIRGEIIPDRYTLRTSQAITHLGAEDYFDIYVLRAGPAAR